jgi:hypothetical protein
MGKDVVDVGEYSRPARGRGQEQRCKRHVVLVVGDDLGEVEAELDQSALGIIDTSEKVENMDGAFSRAAIIGRFWHHRCRRCAETPKSRSKFGRRRVFRSPWTRRRRKSVITALAKA